MTDEICAACGHAERHHDPEDRNCEQHADVGLGRCRCNFFVGADHVAEELLRLRAELVDLQGRYDFCCKERSRAREERHAFARRERAAVVAWLRTRGSEIENWPPGGPNEISLTYDIIADNIARGEHRREDKT